MFRALILSLFLSAPIAAAAQSTVPTSQAQISLSFAPLVRDAAPAVVNIYAKRIVETRVSPFASDPFFKNFFGDLGPARPRVQNSLGSGVILSRDGFMVSNYHVVGGASDIRVVLKDRREFSAEVLLGDKASDLAILRLKDAEDLAVFTLTRQQHGRSGRTHFGHRQSLWCRSNSVERDHLWPRALWRGDGQ